MAKMKLRHIALATQDPERTASFYKEAFGFAEVGRTHPGDQLADGIFLSDGTINMAVLKFKRDQLGKGLDYVGLHHFGVLVENAGRAAERLVAMGSECFLDVEERKRLGDAPGNNIEVKFRGPDGVVFDIADKNWKGAAPAERDDAQTA